MTHPHLTLAAALACLSALPALAGEPTSPDASPGPKSGLLATLSDPDAEATAAGMGAKVVIPPLSPSPSWTLSLGPAYRHMSNGTRYRGATRSRFLNIPSFVGTDSVAIPPIGPETGVGNRDYDNGYVYMDAATATDGSTWYWGHASDSQVSGDDLVFNATGAKSIRSDQTSIVNPLTETKDQEDVRPHIQVHFDNPNRSWRGFQLGFGFSLGQMPLDHGVRFSDYGHVQVRDDYRVDWTDTYDLQGVVPPLAPYNGSLGGPGPIIDNIPAGRESVDVLINTDTAVFGNLVTSRFHGSLFTVSLGPTLTHQHGDVRFRAAGGPTLSLLDWSARQREVNIVTESSGGGVQNVSTYREWNDYNSGTTLVPGIFGQAEAIWQFHENWSASAFGRIDLATSTKLDISSSSYEVDPSGYTFGFQIGRSF